jgi:hypothetical protein
LGDSFPLETTNLDRDSDEFNGNAEEYSWCVAGILMVPLLGSGAISNDRTINKIN